MECRELLGAFWLQKRKQFDATLDKGTGSNVDSDSEDYKARRPDRDILPADVLAVGQEVIEADVKARKERIETTVDHVKPTGTSTQLPEDMSDEVKQQRRSQLPPP